MTTLVVDKEMGYMAADRMVTANDGDVSIPCDTKIERINIGGDSYLVGLAGLEGPGFLFLDWFEHGSWDEPPEPLSIDENEGFTAVVLGHNSIEIADRFMRLTPVHNRWYAAGSGGVFAWAILEAGCGIDKAMSTAIRMDPNSGFGYQIRFLDEEVAEDNDRDCL